jgi:hypothetical protein
VTSIEPDGIPPAEPVAAAAPTPFQPEVYRLTVADRLRGFLWGISEPFRVDQTPAWASVLALLLAISPGVSERLGKGRWGEYDPTIAVLTATLIALIWTAHYTFRAVRHARQAEERADVRRVFERRSMAVGVIAELDYLKFSLAVMRTRIVVYGVHFLGRPQLRNALAHINMFSPPAATALSEFDSVLRQIESHAALYTADFSLAQERHEREVQRSWVGSVTYRPSKILEYDASRIDGIRKMIDDAQALIPLVNQRLIAEG